MIDGTAAWRRSTYSFTIDGDVRNAEYRGATIDEEDIVDGTAVHDAVDADTLGAYRVTGAITEFKWVRDADVEYEPVYP